jgi:Tol biopolymer transport system component
MRDKAEVSELKTRLVLAGITVIAMIVLSGMNHSDEARGAGLQAGSKMLVSSEPKSTVQMPKTNGASERVIQLNAQDATWSADGKRLAFAQGSELYLADGLGSEARLVYSGMGLVGAPRFSVDGKRIQFTVKDVRRNTISLWEVSRDGSNPRTVGAE